jgi:signal transduction histidine kinase
MSQLHHSRADTPRARKGSAFPVDAAHPATLPAGADPTSRSPEDGSGALGALPPVWRVLVTSGADVCSQWPHAEHSVVSISDVRMTVNLLIECVQQALASQPVQLSGFPPFVPARRVLEHMRRAFLARAETGDSAVASADVLRFVFAIERVQSALDDDAAQRFAARLSGEDAQQLVVEMAHDMRSPLGSILILAERLRSGAGGELSALQERQLGLVYSAAFGLSSLAGDVIELARGGTTLLEQPPMSFSVSDVLQSILDILRPMAEEKKLLVRCTGPEADVRVGYQAALNRVLLNLTTNAIKFTNTGTVDVTCTQIDRTRVHFAVQDTGRGIPPHVIRNLFEAFRQRQITGDYAFSSAGLGLSICKKLINAMGGELQVDTELERGTRFHFELDLPQPSRL